MCNEKKNTLGAENFWDVVGQVPQFYIKKHKKIVLIVHGSNKLKGFAF